ncbi:MAG: CotH kinase family protein [Firmicutes bacterium]|nr:CotH kinase family protein [Bacillota bacterium]
MRSFRIIGTLSILFMLFSCGIATILYQKEHRIEKHNSYEEPLKAAPVEQDAIRYIGKDFSVDENFSSHLPIVLLDTNGVEPPINTWLDTEQKRFIAIDGVEPYVEGTISIINGKEELNCLKDTPQTVSSMRIKRRGNSSMLYEKAQWMIKLVAQSGQDNDIDILGMGKEHEWILNGSMFDKSLLRNYLAYSIASEFMPCTPDSYYCEVIMRDGNRYTYQGVYLLMESIKQGPDRVDIAEYKEGDVFNSYLLRRDRYEENVNILKTYGQINGYSKEFFELRYPTRLKASDDTIRYVEKDISRIEEVIYSDDPKVFSRYSEVIDVDSFIDYFLLNEFFASYDAGNFSTYCYKDVGGKLKMGPVWDFDGTMDNYRPEALSVEDMAFQTKPWFDRLCRDENFVKKMEKRYVELRRTSFSEKHVIDKIDEIVAHLGGASQRDWYRWGHWYATENKYSLLPEEAEDGEILTRNAVTYQDEIYRIKTALRDHDDRIPEAIRRMEKQTDRTTGLDEWMGYLLLLASCIFFIPAAYVVLRK